MSDTNINRYKMQLVIGFIFLSYLICGWFYPVIGIVIPGCMLFGIGVALSKGRKWCNTYCPRGCFYDSIMKLASPQKKIPGLFKEMILRVGILSFVMTVMVLQIIRYWPSITHIGNVFMVILTTTTVIGIILGLFIHQRSWCYLCPVGTMANLIGKNKYPLKFDKDKCASCKLCAKSCPMQIEPYLQLSDDCLKCATCVEACPKKALEF